VTSSPLFVMRAVDFWLSASSPAAGLAWFHLDCILIDCILIE